MHSRSDLAPERFVVFYYIARLVPARAAVWGKGQMSHIRIFPSRFVAEIMARAICRCYSLAQTQPQTVHSCDTVVLPPAQINNCLFRRWRHSQLDKKFTNKAIVDIILRPLSGAAPWWVSFNVH